MRRRKQVYPAAKTATKGGARVEAARTAAADRVVSIDLTAMTGRTDIAPGTRVEISNGRYAGEVVTVESVAGGVIPAVAVRTAEGQTRRVRAIDLRPLARHSETRNSEPG
jgi:hypothetical protein